MNKLLMIFAMLCNSMFGQVSADLTIENQEAVGTDFFFDIYLTRTGINNLYLGNADFVLTFNTSNFNSPQLEKVGTSPGSCTFVPTDQSSIYPQITQMNYFNTTAVEILNGNELTINLNGPTPGEQAAFDTGVALIDNSSSTHRLGTFKVSGIENPSGHMNLQWKISSTLVYTLANTTPFTSSEVTINTINPDNEPLPVELSSFTVESNGNNVALRWETITEVNNYGFEVERASTPLGMTNSLKWEKIGFVEGHGNSNSPKSYSFEDDQLISTKIKYRLKQIDSDGSFEYSDVVEITIETPNVFKLVQNYPNPFNPSTIIKYEIPNVGTGHPAKAGQVTPTVRLTIYDMLGREVATLVNQKQNPGYYEVDFDASDLTSGVYFYRITSGKFIKTKKMILLR